MASARSRRLRCSKSSTSALPPKIARLVVVSGPSGAGKTTIVSRLLELRPDLVRGRSVTTRAARPGDRRDVDRRCVTADEFEQMRQDGVFLEWANVHGNLYGTPRKPVDDAIAAGKTMVLEIDVQGARSVRAAVPDALLIFVEPPSPDVLRRRLEARGTEPEPVLERRLSDSRKELAEAAGFDHRVVNDDLEGAVGEVIRILEESPGPERAAASPKGET